MSSHGLVVFSSAWVGVKNGPLEAGILELRSGQCGFCEPEEEHGVLADAEGWTPGGDVAGDAARP